MKPNHKYAPSAAHRELISKLQLQNELMVHLAHLLLTPINTVIEKVEELQTGIHGAFNTEQMEQINCMGMCAHYLQTIVNEISEAVKITKEGLTIIPISAQEVANTYLRFIDELANKKYLNTSNKHPKTSLFIDPAVTVIHADEKYLKAVLFHLLKQAVKCLSQASEIRLEIRGHTEKGLLDLTVLDNRYSWEERSFLLSCLDEFSLFFYLTELHSGHISIEKVDKSTRFTVSLPWQPLTDRPSNETWQTLLAYRQAYLQQKYEWQEKIAAWQLELEIDGFMIPGYSYLHDLRTPLCGVLGPVEILLGGLEGPINAEQSKPLRTIRENAQYFLPVLNKFSDWVKIKVGKLELSAKTTLPITAEKLGLHYIEESAQEKQLKITTTLDPAVTTIQAYEDHFGEILHRLFENAIRFTKEQGAIDLTVRGDAEHGMAHFIISDTGKGMIEEEVNNLFNKQPFVDLDDHLNKTHFKTLAWTPNKLNEDLNLSLSLVYYLVKLHDGKISVTSEIGKGSCFTVSLPWQPVTNEYNG